MAYIRPNEYFEYFAFMLNTFRHFLYSVQQFSVYMQIIAVNPNLNAAKSEAH